MNNTHATGFSLDVVNVASPCRANWADMTGDDKSRHCSQCDMMVYNLSNMTREEAETLTLRGNERTCIRFYRRYDGTVITSDCPVGVRGLKFRLLRTALAICAVVGILLVTPLYAMTFPLRALGSADPLQAIRGWMQPDRLIEVLKIQPEQSVPIPHEPIMGSVIIDPQPPLITPLGDVPAQPQADIN